MEKEYKKFQEKYQLVTLDQIKQDFQISNIEDTEYLLFEIAKQIDDKIQKFATLIEDIINPGTLSTMQEAQNFTNHDKIKLQEIYKILNLHHRKFTQIEMFMVEEIIANYIKLAFDMWQQMKSELDTIVLKLIDAWVEK